MAARKLVWMTPICRILTSPPPWGVLGVIQWYHQWDCFIDKVVGQIINPFQFLKWDFALTEAYLAASLANKNENGEPGVAVSYVDHKYPPGTIVGVKTMKLARNFGTGFAGIFSKVNDSMQTIAGGPVRSYLRRFAHTSGMFPALVHSYGPVYGIEVIQGINGLSNSRIIYRPTFDSLGKPTMSIDIVYTHSGAPTAYWLYENKNRPSLVHYINIWVRSSDDQSDVDVEHPPIRGLFHLYHEKKVGAEITPAHGIPLGEGSYVGIDAIPLKGRYLTEFTVNGADVLASGLTYPPENGLVGLPTGEGGVAQHFYGPVREDVYVVAVAAGIDITYEITAGVPITIQCTTTDCYTEGVNWELGDTDLPAGAVISIDENGTLSIYVPENVYEGIPGGLAYLDFTYTGYSQAITRRLRLTIKPVPAFGTVWTSKALLSQQVKDIFRASDGTCYITGDTMIWRTTDFITFTEHTFDSAITNTFRNCMEASNGRIVVCDARRVWVKAAGSDQFVSTAMTADINTAGSGTAGKPILASPNSNEVHLVSLNYTSYTSVKHLNIDTGATVGIYGIGSGGLYMFPGVIADNGTRILAIGGVSGAHKVWIYRTNGTYAVVVNGGGSGNHTPAVWREETGRIWVRGLAPSGKQFTQYSDDNGETFSAQVDGGLAIGVPGPGLALKRNYSIVSYTNDVYRTPDAFATCPLAQANLAGTKILCFFRLANRKLLAGTNGTTTNLYISEV